MSAAADKLQVALDATLWDEPTTGIGLYTHELAGALKAQGVGVRLYGAQKSGEAPRRIPSRSAYTMLELPVRLAGRERLYHALGNFNLPPLRPSGTRFVLTVHDLIPELFPETVSKPFHWQFRLWLRRSLAIANQVICVSETTRKDLLRLYPGVEASRVHVVYNGVDHVIREPEAAAQDLPAEYILFAGAWDPRKNLALVLDAWEHLAPKKRPPLLLAGQPWFESGTLEKRVAALHAQGHDVRRLGFVSAPVLRTLMKRATVFTFPSRYEGFGLPPLEAMRLGTPCIVSNTGSLPEVCGDAALQVGPDDAQGLAAGLERLLGSKSERDERRAQGLEWANAFTWERSAAQTAAVYSAALQVTEPSKAS